MFETLTPTAWRARRWIALVVTLAAMFAALAAAAGTPEDVALDDATARAKAALGPFKKQLKQTLSSAMQQSGPIAAVDVCRLEAPTIAAGASTEGLRVGRTSHKLRNPANAPAAWMEPLLEELRDWPDRPAPARTVALGNGGFGYVEPIYVQGLCLTCHGANVPTALRDHISERYPDDRAIGFADGDFRGLFWVEVDRASAE